MQGPIPRSSAREGPRCMSVQRTRGPRRKIDGQREPGYERAPAMVSKISTLAAFAFPFISLSACGSDTSSTGTSSNQPTESSYIDACGVRAARCGDAGPIRPDSCTEEYKCYTQAFVDSYATEVLNCLSSRACDKSPESTCLAPAADRVGDKAFQSKCDDRLGECKLDDDYCQEESALFKPEVRAAFEVCLEKDCSAILACLDAALPSSCSF
jgi:hypothetical protein